jgi:vacuolar-type H+-ATPase subunit C/Vma6
VLKKDDEGNWYKADPSESTFDASDKEHSEGGDDETFLVENSIKLYETLTIMRMLAELHNANDASNILGDVLHMTPGSLRELATMSREGVVAKLSEYNQTVGNLLETAMHEFEVFTNWLVEQSDEMRGDGA